MSKSRDQKILEILVFLNVSLKSYPEESDWYLYIYSNWFPVVDTGNVEKVEIKK